MRIARSRANLCLDLTDRVLAGGLGGELSVLVREHRPNTGSNDAEELEGT